MIFDYTNSNIQHVKLEYTFGQRFKSILSDLDLNITKYILAPYLTDSSTQLASYNMGPLHCAKFIKKNRLD